MRARVTSRNQITLPESVRTHLGLSPGSTIEFELLSDRRVCLTPMDGMSTHANATSSRFGALRGTATVKLSTRQIMLLTRGR